MCIKRLPVHFLDLIYTDHIRRKQVIRSGGEQKEQNKQAIDLPQFLLPHFTGCSFNVSISSSSCFRHNVIICRHHCRCNGRWLQMCMWLTVYVCMCLWVLVMFHVAAGGGFSDTSLPFALQRQPESPEWPSDELLVSNAALWSKIGILHLFPHLMTLTWKSDYVRTMGRQSDWFVVIWGSNLMVSMKQNFRQ
jgi:hypothetical protein